MTPDTSTVLCIFILISIRDRKISQKKQFDIRRGQENKTREHKKLNFVRFDIVAFQRLLINTKRCPAIRQWAPGRHEMWTPGSRLARNLPWKEEGVRPTSYTGTPLSYWPRSALNPSKDQ